MMRLFAECRSCGERLKMEVVPVEGMNGQWMRLVISPCQTCAAEYVQQAHATVKDPRKGSEF